jgi:phosphatidylglycerol:prolipoprotein diacylglycerol transferase
LLQRHPHVGLAPRDMDDFVGWAIVGVVMGGRLGSVLLYDADYYIEFPAEIVKVWKGGMSFHGGLVGVWIAALGFCARRGVRPLALLDVLVAVAPVGLFFGRIANFVNGELWGRVTDVPWAVVVPNAGPLARHPSQLYEAVLEGALLFVVLQWIARRCAPGSGVASGVFLLGYGVLRTVVELTREPDAPLIGPFTRGQAYSLPMMIAGVYLLQRAISARARMRDIDAPDNRVETSE